MQDRPSVNYQTVLSAFVQDFYVISGLHIGVHDIRRNHCQVDAGSSDNTLCLHCQNNCAEFLDQCRKCDAQHIETLLTEKKTLVYTCHFGLTEAMIPICDNEIVTGVFFLGRVRVTDQNETDFDSLTAYLEEHYPASFSQGNRDALIIPFRNTPAVTRERFLALVHVAETAIRSLYPERWIRKQDFTARERLSRYLEDCDLIHMNVSELSAERAASWLGISYSQLNRLSVAENGLPFKQYALQVKIKAAEHFLTENPERKVGDIAVAVGFDDVHYFFKSFPQKDRAIVYGISKTPQIRDGRKYASPRLSHLTYRKYRRAEI